MTLNADFRGKQPVSSLPHHGYARTDTIHFNLSDDELDQIYRKAMEIRLFEILEPSPPVVPRINILSFSYSVELQVKAGDVEKTLQWCCDSAPAQGAEIQWNQIDEFLALTYSIVANQPEYKAYLDGMSRQI